MARSVPGSSPTSDAPNRRPSVRETSSALASCTTWLFVSTYPSVEITTPEPAPRVSAPPLRVLIPMLTTEGPTASTTETTAWEYASSSSCSSIATGVSRAASASSLSLASSATTARTSLMAGVGMPRSADRIPRGRRRYA
jgi:hypothetical protein